MEKRCDLCKWYTPGVTERQRHEWSYSNYGKYATGICNLYFPRGYIARKPPHPTMEISHCCQFEAKQEDDNDK